MTIQDRFGRGKGKFTPMYPELGTGPVPYDAEWATPTRAERYETRLSKTIDELLELS